MTAKLAIEVSSRAGDAAAGLGSVDRALDGVARSADQAGEAAERSRRALSVTADSADELGSKAGRATGALGALSSGFELVGAERYAGALQGAAMATDFFSGVGDAANLILETNAVKFARAKAAAVAQGVASGALAVKTAALTAAQGALNIVMSANPIALVVLAVVALVAGFVLAYKKSETFRTAVQTAGRAAAAALGLITLPMRTLLGLIGDAVGAIRDRFPAAFKKAGEITAAVGDALARPFRAVADIVQRIIDLVKKIKLPDLPSLGDLNPFGRVAPPGGGGGPTFGPGGYALGEQTVNYYTFNISGVLDADDAADTIAGLLERRARQTGGL